LPVSLKTLNATYIAMPGHKGLMGPQGTGILLCGRIPEPILQGGTGSNSLSRDMPEFLPDRIEAGTHNVPGICGLCEGMKYLNSVGLDSIISHEEKLLQIACEAMTNRFTVFCSLDQIQTGVLSFQAEGLDCEEAAYRLAKKDIAVRAGLQCAPLAHESAGTVERGTVRISFSPFTTVEELELFLEIAQHELLA
jgi:selenocysteine lyase/cysteine desulfurase